MTMTVTAQAVGRDRMMLIVSGEIDVRGCDYLRDAVTRALLAGGWTELLVDLSAVSFCDCSGIGALVGARAWAAEHDVGLRVINPQRQVRRVLRLSGVFEELSGR